MNRRSLLLGLGALVVGAPAVKAYSFLRANPLASVQAPTSAKDGQILRWNGTNLEWVYPATPEQIRLVEELYNPVRPRKVYA